MRRVYKFVSAEKDLDLHQLHAINEKNNFKTINLEGPITTIQQTMQPEINDSLNDDNSSMIMPIPMPIPTNTAITKITSIEPPFAIDSMEDNIDYLEEKQIIRLSPIISLSKSSYSDIIHFNTNKHLFRKCENNAHWCYFCLQNKFMHKVSCEKFIQKCIKKYIKCPEKFIESKESHMLSTMLCLDNYARLYLSLNNINLFKLLTIRSYAETIDDVIKNGIISQYNYRKIMTDTHYLTKLPENHLSNSDIDKWFIANNLRCNYCFELACPFHYDFGSWEMIQIPDTYAFKKDYCCGWCVDIITNIDRSSVYSSAVSESHFTLDPDSHNIQSDFDKLSFTHNPLSEFDYNDP
jgi:hypothetical protein